MIIDIIIIKVCFKSLYALCKTHLKGIESFYCANDFWK